MSDKPEGQQEPVAAWQRRVLYPENGAKPQWKQCSATEATDQFARSPHHEYRPLFTRPSEQAVTEAAGPFATFAKHAVEKTDDGWVWCTSSNERICDWFGPSDFGSLKAAMEAGG